MTWKDLKFSSKEALVELREEFREELEKKYQAVSIETEHGTVKCYVSGRGEYFYPAFMFGGKDNQFHNLVIEYAKSAEEIIKAWEEEGKLYFPDDFESKESMFATMLEEIES